MAEFEGALDHLVRAGLRLTRLERRWIAYQEEQEGEKMEERRRHIVPTTCIISHYTHAFFNQVHTQSMRNS